MEISTAARIHYINYGRFGVTCISSFFLDGFFIFFYLSFFILTGRRGETDTL